MLHSNIVFLKINAHGKFLTKISKQQLLLPVIKMLPANCTDTNREITLKGRVQKRRLSEARTDSLETLGKYLCGAINNR